VERLIEASSSTIETNRSAAGLGFISIAPARATWVHDSA
jgi:hypothetical protein